MPFFPAWQKWAQRSERGALYAALQLAWWLAEGSTLFNSLCAAFRGSARYANGAAVRPRRARASHLSRAAG